jgi:hypothetical protein
MGFALVGGLWLAGLVALAIFLCLVAPILFFIIKVVFKMLALIVGSLLALFRIRI